MVYIVVKLGLEYIVEGPVSLINKYSTCVFFNFGIKKFDSS